MTSVEQVFRAIQSCDQPGAVALIGAGADVHGRDPDGSTLLGTAVAYHQALVVKALLDAGADPNVCDRDGDPPLRWAVEYQYVGIARLLIEAGADLSCRDALGQELHEGVPTGSDMEELLQQAPALQRQVAANRATREAAAATRAQTADMQSRAAEKRQHLRRYASRLYPGPKP